MRTDQNKLALWKDRLARAEASWNTELAKMDRREALYRGDRSVTPMHEEDYKTRTPHVRNLCAELVESETDSTIPQPKVTARRKKDEDRARLVEDLLRNELDRLPMEEINDMLERIVPVQGGAALLVEWDNTQRSHQTVGELRITPIHPRQMVPQPGIFSGIEDMDYIFLKLPQTKAGILRRYGVDLEQTGEAEPEIRGGGDGAAEDLITQYLAYYRNDNGGIGLYSWAGDQQLEDLEDFQARHMDGKALETEVLSSPVLRSDGSILPPGTALPYYKPSCYPVILIKNISVTGQLLGESDVDKIADQQNTANRLEAKIIDKLCMSGSYLVLPDRTDIQRDSNEMKIVYSGGPAEKNLIEVRDVEGNISQDLTYLQQVYEEARQAIGITDSYQGRRDATATSGKAKEFSAAQAAGRLESKRTVKNAAYARLFEVMFQYKLAYADEPRPVVSQDFRGNPTYEEFNRYDYLEQDAAGEWFVNDQFLFSCDSSAPLASNREAMWQETRANLQSGAFGDPTQVSTLILFWGKMELLHYPGAGETKKFLERQEEERQMAQMRQQMAQAQAAGPQIGGVSTPGELSANFQLSPGNSLAGNLQGSPGNTPGNPGALGAQGVSDAGLLAGNLQNPQGMGTSLESQARDAALRDAADQAARQAALRDAAAAAGISEEEAAALMG